MSPPYTRLFGDLLNHYLSEHERGISWLARRIGVSYNTVKRWGNYENLPDHSSDVIRIADAFSLNETECNELLEAANYPDLARAQDLIGDDDEKAKTAFQKIRERSESNAKDLSESTGMDVIEQAADRLVQVVEKRISSRFPLFANVPAMPNHFVGRDAIVNRLVERLINGTDLALSSARPIDAGIDRIALEGLPGIGKTTLAVALARDGRVRQHFSDGILWGGLGREGSATRVLNRWADELGRTVSESMTDLERAALITSAIGQRHVLIVIDDAWDTKAARVLRCGGPNCCHLLTTRDLALARDFAGLAQMETIPALNDEASWRLLEALAPEICRAAPDTVQKLVKVAGGLPLTLALLGGMLAAPEHSMFEDLALETAATLENLSNPMSPMSRLELAMQRLGSLEDRELTLYETIALGLEVLPDETRQAFNDIGAFAPKPERFGRKDAESILNTSSRTLAILIARNLVERISDSELALHQTLADAARAKTSPEATACHRDYYLAQAAVDLANWREIETIYGQVNWSWRTVPHDASMLKFIGVLGPYQALRGLWIDNGVWVEQASKVAEEQNWEVALKAALLHLLGLAHDHQGRWDESAAAFERLIAFAESDDVEVKAIAMQAFSMLGNIYYKQGRWQHAIDMHMACLELSQELEDPRTAHDARNNLGVVYRNAGQIEDAFTNFKQNLEYAVETENPLATARALSQLSKVMMDLLRFDEVHDMLTQCLHIAQELGDRDLEETTYSDLGALLRKHGRLDEARQMYERSLEIDLDIGDVFNEAKNSLNIGLIYQAQEQFQHAQTMLTRSRQLAQMLGSRKIEAKCWMLLGINDYLTGFTAQAIAKHETALGLAQMLGDKAFEDEIRGNLAVIPR